MKKLLLLCLMPVALFGMDSEKNSIGQDAERAAAILTGLVQRYEDSSTAFNDAVMHGTFDEHVHAARVAELRDIRIAVTNFLTATPVTYVRVCNCAHDLLSRIRLAEVALPYMLQAYFIDRGAAH